MIARLGRRWVELADSECHGCGMLHVLELEVRCEGCDRGVCASCVVRAAHGAAAYCSECAAESMPEGGITARRPRTAGRRRRRG